MPGRDTTNEETKEIHPADLKPQSMQRRIMKKRSSSLRTHTSISVRGTAVTGRLRENGRIDCRPPQDMVGATRAATAYTGEGTADDCGGCRRWRASRSSAFRAAALWLTPRRSSALAHMLLSAWRVHLRPGSAAVPCSSSILLGSQLSGSRKVRGCCGSARSAPSVCPELPES